eukprot:scaffold410671_cov16-Prasinocladus_malaysianus.AAC.1
MKFSGICRENNISLQVPGLSGEHRQRVAAAEKDRGSPSKARPGQLKAAGAPRPVRVGAAKAGRQRPAARNDVNQPSEHNQHFDNAGPSPNGLCRTTSIFTVPEIYVIWCMVS